MNIDEARNKIQKAKLNQSKSLFLGSFEDKEKLTSKEIIELLPEIKEIKCLTKLNLSSNKITDISFLLELKQLTSLVLSNNTNIQNIILLKEMENLEELYLSNVNTIDINFITELKKLKLIDLTNNRKLLIPLNKIRKRQDNDFWLAPYPILQKEEIEQLVRYYEQIKKIGFDYIFEAKMLIVGEPGAGKTTLFEKMKDSNYLPTKNSSNSTVGIQIDTIEFPYCKDEKIAFITHIWDFGGQPIQYILHQYFFTERSLYVLLADDRKQLTNFGYWFEIIATLGKDCPVLVVLNEINHQSVTNFDLSEYQKEFGRKVRSIEKREVDFLFNDLRFKQLKELIKSKLCDLPHIGKEKVPKTWIPLREQLEKESKKHPYIRMDRYDELCEMSSVSEQYRKDVLRYFHDLGIALNYESDDNLDDIVILNPHWIIDALYVVLKSKEIKNNNGRFSKEFVYNLWKNQNYQKRDDHKFLLRLMKKGKFEVAYKIEGKNEYIAPILLPDFEPSYYIDKKNPIEIYFQYAFMPPGIFSRLVVRLSDTIVIQDNKQVVWKKGVLIRDEDAFAEILESEHKKRISIKVSGSDFIKNRGLLTIIRNEIRKIHKDWFENRIECDEFVPCICNTCIGTINKSFFKLNKLEERIRNNMSTIECENKPYYPVKIRKLLEGVYQEEIRSESDFMGDTYNFYSETQFVKGAKDDVSITQNNYKNYAELKKKIEEVTNIFNQKLDVIISKQDEAKINQEKATETTINEVQNWLNEIMHLVGTAFDLLDDNEINRFEELKEIIEKSNAKEDWESNLTLVVPFLDKIGIKLESKTKIKDLNDLKEKVKGLIWKNNESKELEGNELNKQLDE